MTQTAATFAQQRSSLPRPAAAAPAWRQWLAGAACLAGAGLAWNGGPPAVAGAALAALGAASGFGARGKAGSRPEPAIVLATGGRQGASVMVEQVVPIWSRQMGVTRQVATDGLAEILNSFSEMSSAVQTLVSALDSVSLSVKPGAVDGAVRRESPALAALLAPSERAFAQRDAAVAEIGRCSDALLELKQLAKQAREISRHTRLVAFNASIEARRGHQQEQGGTQAVAAEVRTLADRMAEVGERIGQVVMGLGESLQKARRQGEASDTSAEELRMEIDLRAREALNALLASMGSALQNSGELKQVSGTLAEQIDNTFVHFQFGDRVSQMLSIISNDMLNFARWVNDHPRATQSDAAEWLAALEASYTMEEQRSHHHGNVHVQHNSGVEFF
jgi:methyl-accepting chemotaxis protein